MYIIICVCLLQTNYILSATELADILETTPRNVKAYIESLRLAGVPIDGLSGRRGGYFISEAYEFKPPRLNENEYNAILLAEEMLTQENGFHYEREIKAAFAKIKAAQGGIMGKSNFIAEDDSVFAKGNVDVSPKIKTHLSTIRKAISSRKKISILYNNPTKKQVTIRKVEPYNLIYRNSSWYVIGHCNLRDAIRIFKIARIESIEVLNERYYVPLNFSITTYMRNTLDLINPGKEYNVEIRFYHPASVWVSEKLWLPTQKIVWLEDDSIIFKAKVNGLTDIKKWVLGYGRLAKVLKPKKLVDELKKEIGDMASVYE
ncbi:MAG: transcriptional regulator [Clostridiales bacterium]|nr:transcriptional regulator [Clostridiales bacterium]